MTVEFREAEAADESQILDLINLVQPSVPWTERHFRWQYQEAPAGAAALFVAGDGGRVVSFYAAPRYAVGFFGEIREGWMVQDVMTHPEYRGRGYLHTLGALCLGHLRQAGALGYTFPNERSENSFRRMGWAELGKVPFRSRIPGQAPQAAPVPLTPVDRFPDSIGDTWEEAGMQIGVRRDAEYLNWRYAKPAQRYMRYTLPSALGAVVLKEYEADDARKLHICDLFVHRDARGEIPGVLAAILRIARDAEVGRLTAWLPHHHPYAAQFDAAGLILDETHSRTIFVDAPESDRQRLSEMQYWHVTHGDSDVW